jgi:hypothetical protein
MYMLTEDDLLAAARTAFVHTRPGGAAVFAPDAFADDFAESTVLLEHTEGDRAMRGIQWSFDPDPNDTTHLCDYVFALRDGTDVRVVHDRHVEGLFPRATWVRILESVGFRVSTFGRPRDDEGGFDQCFVCVR